MPLSIADAQHIGYGKDRTAQGDGRFHAEIDAGNGKNMRVALVCDGITPRSDEVHIGQVVLDAVQRQLKRAAGMSPLKLMNSALQAAHDAIREKYASGTRDLSQRIGASATLAIITPDQRLFLAHIGSSRAYLLRDGKLAQLTLEHTWGAEKVAAGLLSFAEADLNQRRSEITHYLGEPAARPAISYGIYLEQNGSENQANANQGMRLQSGDTLLLCTDGLVKNRGRSSHHYVEPDEIEAVLKTNHARDAVNTLISYATSREVDDNVTAMVIEMPGARKGFAQLQRLPRRQMLAALGIGGAAMLLLSAFIIISLLTPRPDVIADPGHVYFIDVQGLSVQSQYPNQESQPIEAGSREYTPGMKIITGPDSRLRMSLSDGSVLYLIPNTAVTLERVADPATNTADTLLKLGQGGILVAIQNKQWPFMIQADITSTTAQVEGSVMGTEFTPDGQRLVVDCFEGHCRIGGRTTGLSLLACQRSQVISLGEPEQPPTLSQNEYWRGQLAPILSAGVIPDSTTCAPTPAPRPTDAPTPTATKAPFNVLTPAGEGTSPVMECGNTICVPGEEITCPEDCPPPAIDPCAASSCGDHTCEGMCGENAGNCAIDCGQQQTPPDQCQTTCGDEKCKCGETPGGCPDDCGDPPDPCDDMNCEDGDGDCDPRCKSLCNINCKKNDMLLSAWPSVTITGSPILASFLPEIVEVPVCREEP